MADGWSKKHLPFYVERRTHVRRGVIQSNLISVALGDAGRGVLIDVGEGGVAVQPFVQLPVGAQSDIQFTTPSGARVKAQGLVAWVGHNGRTGIRFTEVEPASLAELRRWTSEAEEEIGVPWPPPATQPHTIEASGERPPQPRPTLVARTTEVSVQEIVRRAAELTGADGAAIALRELGAITCAASVGNAPDVGVVVTPGKGMAGLCVRSAEPVLCCDARSDRRVELDAALALNMGSCAMVPVVNGTGAMGLLAVFSKKTDAFNEEHLTALSEMAKTIASGS
jgi:hypothetical protein